jgi:hypothetical protein
MKAVVEVFETQSRSINSRELKGGLSKVAPPFWFVGNAVPPAVRDVPKRQTPLASGAAAPLVPITHVNS